MNRNISFMGNFFDISFARIQTKNEDRKVGNVKPSNLNFSIKSHESTTFFALFNFFANHNMNV